MNEINIICPITKQIFCNPVICDDGNVYEKDIIGAKKSGMKTVFFNELIIKRDFPKADKIINNLNELVYSIDYFC